MLLKLRDYFQQRSEDPDSFMLWVAVSTCFFGLMCAGEMTVALLAYLALRGNGPGFLFLFANGCQLTKQRFIYKVREALASVGVDPSQYAGHSFRIWAATTADACSLNAVKMAEFGL